MSDPNAAKRAAAYAAADLVESGMKIGLGSGSTFLLAVERLQQRIAQDGLQVAGVPSSRATAEAAAAAGITLLDLEQIDRLDLAIDGADEVDPQKNLIKGGGGAHVRERIVAAAAKELIVIIDDKKLVPVLGVAFPLPIEVLQFGWKQAERMLTATGCAVTRREKDGAPFVSDNGNYVLDCKYESIEDPAWLAEQLHGIVGIVDHGLFVGMAGRVLVGDASGKVRTIP
ncbi:MAG: ribose-5-phosphate isomerase RpiA [Planctomycetes bacterium]|nr:ribose-5-phosphate isomerase RpiA [Planctomycetota bacterium]